MSYLTLMILVNNPVIPSKGHRKNVYDVLSLCASLITTFKVPLLYHCVPLVFLMPFINNISLNNANYFIESSFYLHNTSVSNTCLIILLLIPKPQVIQKEFFKSRWHKNLNLLRETKLTPQERNMDCPHND